jgi:hypothetical protein
MIRFACFHRPERAPCTRPTGVGGCWQAFCDVRTDPAGAKVPRERLDRFDGGGRATVPRRLAMEELTVSRRCPHPYDWVRMRR